MKIYKVFIFSLFFLNFNLHGLQYDKKRNYTPNTIDMLLNSLTNYLIEIEISTKKFSSKEIVNLKKRHIRIRYLINKYFTPEQIIEINKLIKEKN